MTRPDSQVLAAVLDLDRVSVSYGAGVVVEDVSVEIESGEWLGLIGANGAGKSSLLKAVAGLVEHQGRVLLGPELTTLGSSRAIAYLPQSPTLPPGMTVAEYTLLGRSAHLRWYASEGRRDHEAVDRALARLDLTAHASRLVTELSGGEAQRVVLARALTQEARLLLLDEPTSALDFGHQIGVLELIDELRRDSDLTVISAMHDLTAAGRFADRLLLMANGRALAVGSPSEVLTPAMLQEAYGAAVSLLTAPDGSLIVVPERHAGAFERSLELDVGRH